MKAVEIPFPPRNAFVNFMLEQFGRPQRNSGVQCDCERDGNGSVLQVLSFANHPRVWQKISDEKGLAARIAKDIADDAGRVEELFLAVLSRPPSATEREACVKYLKESATPAKGLQGSCGACSTRASLCCSTDLFTFARNVNARNVNKEVSVGSSSSRCSSSP